MEKFKLYLNTDLDFSSSGVIYKGVNNCFSGVLFETSPYFPLPYELWEKLDENQQKHIFPYPVLPPKLNESCNENSGIDPKNLFEPNIGLGYLSLYKKHHKDYNAKVFWDRSNKIIHIWSCKLIKPESEIIINTLNYVK